MGHERQHVFAIILHSLVVLCMREHHDSLLLHLIKYTPLHPNVYVYTALNGMFLPLDASYCAMMQYRIVWCAKRVK